MRFVCLFCLIFLSHYAPAQQGRFEEGYYISPAKDTVRGLLSREPDEVLARGLYFKPDQQSPAERVIPASAKEVFFTGSRETFVAIPHTYLPFTEETPRTEGRFMLLLLQARKRLYRMALTPEEQKREGGQSENKIYYLEDGDDFYKLEALRRYTSVDHSTYTEQGRFKEVLKYLLREEDISTKRIDRTLFEDESIIKLLMDSGVLGENVELEEITKTGKRKPVRNYYLDVGFPFELGRSRQLTGYTFGGLLAFRNPAKSSSRMFSIGFQYGFVELDQVFDQAPAGNDTEATFRHVSVPIGLYWEPEVVDGKPFSVVGGFGLSLTSWWADGTVYYAPDPVRMTPGRFSTEEQSNFGIRFNPELGIRLRRFALVGRGLVFFGGLGAEPVRSIDFLFRMRLKP